MPHPKIYFYDSADEQAKTLSEQITDRLLSDIKERGKALLILAGGSSPRKLISLLAKTKLSWDKIKITVTDERCVSLESKDSNVGQIIRLFLEQGVAINPITLTQENVESLDFPATVTVLGMGLDGHTASLFPKQSHSCGDALLVDALAPAEPKARKSLSMEALIDTKYLVLLVNGQDKWDICRNVIEGKNKELPVSKLFHLAKEKLSLCVCITK